LPPSDGRLCFSYSEGLPPADLNNYTARACFSYSEGLPPAGLNDYTVRACFSYSQDSGL
jgi:hypothetical protein